MRGRLSSIEPFMIVVVCLASTIILFLLSPLIALFIAVDPVVFKKSLFEDPVLASEAWNSLYITLTASTTSTLILLAMGLPLAYILAYHEFMGKNFLEALIDIPLMIPHAIAGIMILIAYGRLGLFSNILGSIGVGVEDSFWGIVFVMAFVSAPIMIDTLKIGFRNIDPDIVYVARSLGASRWRAFYTIILPLSTHSLLAGSILSWARAVSEVGAILVIAYYPKSANILVIEWFNVYGLKYAISISIVLVLISLTVFTLLKTVVKK